MFSKSKLFLFILFSTLLFLFSSCKSTSIETVFQELKDGKYDSEFPYRNGSKQLNDIANTIKMLHCMAFYEKYNFDISDKMSKQSRFYSTFTNNARSITYYHETSSGTATTIYAHNNKVAMLTCAHILSYPDTIIAYFADEDGNPTNLIQSISVKNKQINYLPEFSHKVTIDTIVTDKGKDLAILGGNYDISELIQFPVFDFPLGNSANLDWGSFVYLFGYPLNNKMLSKGIVSKPQSKDSKSFFVDANINRGFSGGIVIAIRDGIPNFELVGLIKSSPAESEFSLVPAKKNDDIIYDSTTPYEGKVYVKHSKRIKYGLTKVIPVNLIIEFINSNMSKLTALNYNSEFFFQK